jgi:hypothetical protein
MNRPPHFLASALTAGVLLSAAACVNGEGGREGGGDQGSAKAAASPVAEESAAASPTAPAPALTDPQARAALIGSSDLGEQWAATKGGATWRDALLKGSADVADCQRLLDGLYAEDLLGEPKGARAVTGFDESDNEAQLRYQVAAYGGQADVDAKLAWLRTLPDKCGRFTATDVRGGRQTVQVGRAALPGVGDAREGLRMTVSGELDGEATTLTLDFAAARVGDRAVSLTNGGLGGAEGDTTKQAVTLGTQRLQDVLAGRPPATQQG